MTRPHDRAWFEARIRDLAALLRRLPGRRQQLLLETLQAEDTTPKAQSLTPGPHPLQPLYSAATTPRSITGERRPAAPVIVRTITGAKLA